MIERVNGVPFSSTAINACIAVLIPIEEISSGNTLPFSMATLTLLYTAAHITSGSCSAHPTFG